MSHSSVMSQSSVLASFDPLAVHPFTNTSGLLPKPAAPSQYPMPLPSSATLATAPPSTAAPPALAAPQPRHASPSKAGGAQGAKKGPIFVPFRPERSSPDLEDILLKKKVSDVLSNKQTWSIDRAPAPKAAARY
ncbi:uncharacterized protein PHACADRAFT_256842 [Phanerochaete carnosa HHB-10118-sp]|uniref:Uncharacterized protein n=1 Tax=Phanerochaete carnosa (strain HHB-10118-sp) TaxID=650164 RepID=K5WAB9_PHACS|nr:uncharacterized protein PHACADRAFT_256842 [Phanerochaete carnosa HHB-10118-sp]EKM55909.1 hypothetical protein PHACADRAFT_256842 [Phanerochaete carnosa HHB-10118-sp]